MPMHPCMCDWICLVQLFSVFDYSTLSITLSLNQFLIFLWSWAQRLTASWSFQGWFKGWSVQPNNPRMTQRTQMAKRRTYQWCIKWNTRCFVPSSETSTVAETFKGIDSTHLSLTQCIISITGLGHLATRQCHPPCSWKEGNPAPVPQWQCILRDQILHSSRL